jgi:hypothetical protein
MLYAAIGRGRDGLHVEALLNGDRVLLPAIAIKVVSLVLFGSGFMAFRSAITSDAPLTGSLT